MTPCEDVWGSQEGQEVENKRRHVAYTLMLYFIVTVTKSGTRIEKIIIMFY